MLSLLLVLFAPFGARAAHVVKLGPVSIKESNFEPLPKGSNGLG